MEKFLFSLKSRKIFQVFTIFVRYLLGAAFVWASVLKIRGIRFTPTSAEHAPIHSLPHLLESMYRSGFYWYFIGWAQYTAGFLLMSQVFSTLGAVVYFPLMLSIFILTTYFQSPGILAVTSLMLLANIYLLLWDWNRIKFIVLNKPGEYIDQSTPFSRQKIWTYIGIGLWILISIFRVISTQHYNWKPDKNGRTIKSLLFSHIWSHYNTSQVLKFLSKELLQHYSGCEAGWIIEVASSTCFFRAL